MTCNSISRRQFGLATTSLGVGGLGAGLLGIGTSSTVFAQTNIATGARPRVVIIGGGAGGASLAHLLRRGWPEIDVTLIEAQAQYTTCFFSNLYIGGFRSLESITHSYQGLRAVGVTLIQDTAIGVDAQQKTVRLQGGATVPYDKLVLAPGIDLKLEAIAGYADGGELAMPHAYKAGVQTKRLKDQLEAMEDGGTVVLAPPQNPYRCPPGPYERACMIAHFLKMRKPRSKLIILDPKKAFSKQALFVEAFEQMYKGIVELHLTTEIDDQALKRVDPRTMEVETIAGKKIKAAVANVIPPQRAGAIARIAGATDGDWCPVKADTFESTLLPNVYVIGDASVAGEMPKSAFSANSQAKAVSNDIEAQLAGKPKYPTRFRNTCWSMLSPANSVKIGASYLPKDGKVTATSTFVSKTGEDALLREKSLKESNGWYAGIIAEAFNKRVEQI